MKKIIATILSTLVCTTLFTSGAALSCAQNTTAFAEDLPQITAELVAPTSYEQYLALTSPTDVAASETAIAIADGNTLYIYDRIEECYRTYEHSSPILQVDFDENGTLYFRSRLQLYRLTSENLEKGTEATHFKNIRCSRFAIENNRLACINDGVILLYTLPEADDPKEINLTGIQGESPIAFGKDGLYCVLENEQNGYTMYAINLETYGLTPITKMDKKIKSLAIANHLLCLISEDGAFYSYNLTDLSASESATDLTPITKEEGNFISLGGYGADAYAIQGNIIRYYTSSSGSFTDYEISASSPSYNRLHGATDLLLQKNKLFLADDGNDRISVYNVETKEFGTPISTELSAPYLASYQNTLLVASKEEAVIYSLASKTYGKELIILQPENINGNVIGVTGIYGKYYLLTDNNYCYTFSKESGSWEWTETHKNTQTLRATAFTADLYGSLYVAYDNAEVYRFTEAELTSADANGKKVLTGLYSPKKIAVDYEMNFYALTGNQLQQYTQKEGGMYALNDTYALDYNLVNDENPTLLSFAFNETSKHTYLLYEGDYVVKTDELQIPEVNPIPVGDANDLIFGTETPTQSAVTVSPDSILIEFDISSLESATEFPYVTFERTQEEQTAFKIGEEGEYTIVAIHKTQTGKYSTCLVLTSSCSPVKKEQHFISYEKEGCGYLTNDIPLYKFPYLNG
ncbi:MAG: hypothetical protein IJW96_04385, partial [Clostridia bacterium]|nr:hypothetical protein [Clostridia bacterium]